MRVSARAHYSLRMMTEFAKGFGDGPLSLAEVSRVEHLPLAYLEQLAAQLRRAGLLESTRGVHGGYSLTRPPEEISVLDILSVVEGTVAPVECLSPGYESGACVRDSGCASRGLWGRLKDSIESVMRATSLAEMVGDTSLLHDIAQVSDITLLPMAASTTDHHEASHV